MRPIRPEPMPGWEPVHIPAGPGYEAIDVAFTSEEGGYIMTAWEFTAVERAAILRGGEPAGPVQGQDDAAGRGGRGWGRRMKKMTVEERFWSKTRPAENGCIEWTGACHPYGQFHLAPGTTIAAHRFAYALAKGPIPDYPGSFVLHSCDNPPCVNPAHLRVGTHQDNMDDMFSRGRFRGGPPTGPANSSCRLSEQQVMEIRRLRGIESQRALSQKFRVGTSTIVAIHLGQTWREVGADLIARPRENTAPRRSYRGDANPAAKLTEADVREIRRLRGIESGVSLAKRFGVTPSRISALQRGKGWASV